MYFQLICLQIPELEIHRSKIEILHPLNCWIAILACKVHVTGDMLQRIRYTNQC